MAEDPADVRPHGTRARAHERSHRENSSSASERTKCQVVRGETTAAPRDPESDRADGQRPVRLPA
ncbi:MAG: hypothetical protein AVDCRST_MAG17-274 [uncultured Solirubrobacterales bacterium]|uniref:Uncharacterized protein n=1 Tax=uncultured Solirubrobacterales bacterium TaxID=768556 RepID=A0A6J4RUW6_9ACTN|nr:MAG: hypothetical protein AVDCRST_MAG17-274 [uncultured Solirubrobacterales bacterium]